jgi:16S rRNA (cytosine967-C5)-methyltransferase
VEEHFTLNQQLVVQDLNSQRVGNLLEEVTSMYHNHELFRVWDCCAASGGKSIMTIDRFPSAELTVSDIRSSIIDNLRRRFRDAGIYQFQSLVVDLAEKVPDLAPQDLIIADVPCTGSGTWSRSPENLLTFNSSSIEQYSRLQRRIVTNAVKRLAPDGYLLYITCSVFRKENEENVQHFTEELPLTVISRSLLPGYKEKADSMFAALLKHK